MFAFLIVRGKKIKKTLAHTEFKTHFNSFMSSFFFFDREKVSILV